MSTKKKGPTATGAASCRTRGRVKEQKAAVRTSRTAKEKALDKIYNAGGKWKPRALALLDAYEIDHTPGNVIKAKAVIEAFDLMLHIYERVISGVGEREASTHVSVHKNLMATLADLLPDDDASDDWLTSITSGGTSTTAAEDDPLAVMDS